MSYHAWNWPKSLWWVLGGGGVCKAIIVFSLAQAEKLSHSNVYKVNKMLLLFNILPLVRKVRAVAYFSGAKTNEVLFLILIKSYELKLPTIDRHFLV